MTPEQLKASILQYAIQGRLVEQLASERLSESTVMKALDRNCEDVPFEIPDKWCWCHLEDIATLHNGRAYKKAEMLKTGKYPLLRVGNLFTSDTWYYSDMELEPEKYCDNGDLLYAWSASFGPHIWNGGKVIYHYHIWKVELRYPQMRDYLYWVLAAQTNAIKRRGHGLTMIHITKAGTEKMLIPVPPFNEQKRIVAKIEELLPYIDRYAAAYEKLEQFNAKFPEDMKKSILQYAIQGKLVEQRPEEGTGEELYQQIQSEKQRLIKEGKIRKEKPLPEIAEDEIPFDIPGSWKWVRWGNLSYSIQYGYNAPAKQAGKIKMVRIRDIQDGKVVWDSVPFCDIKNEEIPTYLLAENDILFARTGGTVGKSYIVKEIPEKAIYAGYLIRTRYSGTLCPEYLYYFMQTNLYWTQLRNGTIATAQPNCNGQTLSKMILPIPPLAEQKRIVAKLEELLPLCDRLRK